jgi:alkylation response protein AidB-like acyl-CoA dehydrogenase
MDFQTLQTNVASIAEDFAAHRRERQLRRTLDPSDFARLAEAGFLQVGVPEAMGGLWTNLAQVNRPVCDTLRTLARGDSSVALVSAMHPAVLSFWLCQPAAPAPYTEAWEQQIRSICQTALDGAWWGTITSEPGSGGDVGKTRTVARKQQDGSYTLTGQKHFGSGSGATSFMVTTALPEGEDMADWFYIDTRGAAWDGSTGMKLVAEWDGHGMIATQSHAFDFTDFPAQRMAWPGNLRVVSGQAGALVASMFTSVVVGVTQAAVEAARAQLGRHLDDVRPYERVEWVSIENEWWLIERAYEGLLNAVEAKGTGGTTDAFHAKMAIANLSESVTGRICRVAGGGSYHRSSPYGAAFEDVRALGFLRPPWALAYDQLWDRTWM